MGGIGNGDGFYFLGEREKDFKGWKGVISKVSRACGFGTVGFWERV